MTFSSEIENFKRATHQTPIFVGNSRGQDWKFQARLKFSSEIENFSLEIFKRSSEIVFFQDSGPPGFVRSRFSWISSGIFLIGPFPLSEPLNLDLLKAPTRNMPEGPRHNQDRSRRKSGTPRFGPPHRLTFSHQAVSNRWFVNRRFSQLNDERCWHVPERSPSKCCNLPVKEALYFVGKTAKRAVTSGWRVLTDVPTSLVIQLRKPPVNKSPVKHSLISKQGLEGQGLEMFVTSEFFQPKTPPERRALSFAKGALSDHLPANG